MPATITRSIRLECRSGNHFKFYCIFELDDDRIEVHYGAIGSSPQQHIYRPGDNRYKNFDELLRAKTRRHRSTGTYRIADENIEPTFALDSSREDREIRIAEREIPALTDVHNSTQIREYVSALFQVEVSPFLELDE